MHFTSAITICRNQKWSETVNDMAPCAFATEGYLDFASTVKTKVKLRVEKANLVPEVKMKGKIKKSGILQKYPLESRIPWVLNLSPVLLHEGPPFFSFEGGKVYNLTWNVLDKWLLNKEVGKDSQLGNVNVVSPTKRNSKTLCHIKRTAHCEKLHKWFHIPNLCCLLKFRNAFHWYSGFGVYEILKVSCYLSCHGPGFGMILRIMNFLIPRFALLSPPWLQK